MKADSPSAASAFAVIAWLLPAWQPPSVVAGQGPFLALARASGRLRALPPAHLKPPAEPSFLPELGQPLQAGFPATRVRGLNPALRPFQLIV